MAALNDGGIIWQRISSRETEEELTALRGVMGDGRKFADVAHS
jgi:hypothetical protein